LDNIHLLHIHSRNVSTRFPNETGL